LERFETLNEFNIPVEEENDIWSGFMHLNPAGFRNPQGLCSIPDQNPK
jgi:hypothetical protein